MGVRDPAPSQLATASLFDPASGARSSVKWAVAAGSEILQLYNFPVYLGTRVARKGQDTQLKLNFR